MSRSDGRAEASPPARPPEGGASPSDGPRLDDQLCFALYAAARAMTQAYRPYLERLGLTYPQYLVMLVLWEHGALNVRTLGERLMLDSGTLTPLLKRLQTQGLLSRSRNAQDERQLSVTLTPAGRALEARTRALFDQIWCAFAPQLADHVALRAQLHGLIGTLRGAAEKLDAVLGD